MVASHNWNLGKNGFYLKDAYSKHFKACPREGGELGRRPSGESEERILIRDRGRVPKGNDPET